MDNLRKKFGDQISSIQEPRIISCKNVKIRPPDILNSIFAPISPTLIFSMTYENPHKSEISHPDTIKDTALNLNKSSMNSWPFIGQEKIANGLHLQIEAAKLRNVPVSHFLVSGAENMGKSTLAKIAASIMGVNFRVIDCGGKLKPGDLASVLTQLRPGDFLILERIELLTDTLVHVLTAPMESFTLDVVVGKGNAAKTVKLNLPRFTVVGLTSQSRQISKRLQSLFLYHYEFEPYNPSECSQLIDLFVKNTGQVIVPEAANLLANYCKGTIDNIHSLAKKVADFCLVKNRSNQIEYSDAVSALDSLGYLNKSNSLPQITDVLCKMTGIEFENFNADLFSKIGYAVEFTKASGDHGIDLFLKQGSEIIAVQCKRWDKPVGEPVIRDFYGALLNSGAVRGIIVTTTTFTAQAHSFIDKKPITLIDIDNLVELVKYYYVKLT